MAPLRSIALSASFALLAAAQSSSVQIFFPEESQLPLAASVITADADSTVYAIGCSTSASSSASASAGVVDPDPVDNVCAIGTMGVPALTITAFGGPTPTSEQFSYVISTQTTVEGQTVSVSASAKLNCKLGGTTSASCSEVATVAYDGSTQSIATGTEIPDASRGFIDIPVTAGASKLSNAGSSSGASGSSNAAVPVMAKAGDVAIKMGWGAMGIGMAQAFLL